MSVVSFSTPATPSFWMMNPPAPSEKLTPSKLELTFAAPIRMAVTGGCPPGPSGSLNVTCSRVKSPSNAKSGRSSEFALKSIAMFRCPVSRRNGPLGNTRLWVVPALSTTKVSLIAWLVLLI